MSEVLRFWCYEASNIRCVRESDYDAAQSELAALREELAKSGSADHLRQRIAFLTAEIHKQAERLTAAEQRNAELEKDAARWNFFSTVANDLQAFPHSWGKMTPEKMNHMCDEAMEAAIKPTESGASE